MDFTLSTYCELLKSLQNQDYSFLSFEDYLRIPLQKSIIIRHDVDALPQNSLDFARIEAEHNIKGTYYFRIVPESYNEKIIKEISSLGHEIGYHYEDIIIAERQKKKVKRQKSISTEQYGKELAEIAIESFDVNLKRFRKIVPVNTICMHGSPLSKWDSRLLWKYYDYREFGLSGEPYFDIDFNKVLYLTDTGRRWDGDAFNVRDKAQGTGHMAQGSGDQGNQQPKTFLSFHLTFDIIHTANKGTLPDKIMLTFHPQRWTDKPYNWIKEFAGQNIKNGIKYFLITLRD